MIAIILLVLYEVLILVTTGAGMKTMNAVDVWMDTALNVIPFSTYIAIALMIVMFIYHLQRDRNRGIRLKGKTLGYMLGESLVWALIIFFNLGFLLIQIPGFAELMPKQAAGAGGDSFLHSIALSLGAGFYEEFFFRLLLVSFLLFLMPIIFPKMGKFIMKLLIVLVTAVLFSLAHHIPPHGEPLTLYVFLFRTAFGIVMSLLMVTRGFGITAWTHALYDVLIDVRNVM